jgi:hypothetical protein
MWEQPLIRITIPRDDATEADELRPAAEASAMLGRRSYSRSARSDRNERLN